MNNNIKVCLIYLPHPYLNEPDAQAPLGLLYIASVLKEENYNVILKNYSSYTEEQAIKDLPQAEIYGITVTALELLQANEFAKKIKEKYKNSIIILGGAGAISDEYVDFNIIDSILKGEGELTINNMINDALSGYLKKIYIGTSISDLDILPYPAREMLEGKKGGNIFAFKKTYDKTFKIEYKNKGSTTILTSRGCPYHCTFCASPSLNYKMRFREPQEVYKEIKYCLDKFKIKQYRFSDEMFTANKNHVEEICKLIKPLGIVWRISARVKPLSLDILKIMKKSGCFEISFGIESFDNDVLKGLNKGTTAEDNAKALEMAKSVGMTTRALFMIRTPFQSKNTVQRNIEWLKKVPYDTIAVTSFVPLPGSEIWQNPDKFNIEILNKNLNDYNFYFYGSKGKNELKNIIKIKDRSLEEFNKESEYFRDWIEKEGKTNRG